MGLPPKGSDGGAPDHDWAVTEEPDLTGMSDAYFRVNIITLLLRLEVNEISCRLRMAQYRDGVKRKGDKIEMGL